MEHCVEIAKYLTTCAALQIGERKREKKKTKKKRKRMKEVIFRLRWRNSSMLAFCAESLLCKLNGMLLFLFGNYKDIGQSNELYKLIGTETFSSPYLSSSLIRALVFSSAVKPICRVLLFRKPGHSSVFKLPRLFFASAAVHLAARQQTKVTEVIPK